MPDVSIVIPNYNGISYLEGCLKSIQEQKNIHPEVIVVDNGSTDGSQDYIQKEFPFCKLICLDRNYGFCKAVNEGFQAAESEYVILLNNDTEVKPEFSRKLLDAIRANRRRFSCQACMLQYQNPELADDAGDFLCAFGWAFARGKGKPASEYQKSGRIFSSCAGAAIYRKSLVQKLGGFDEAHFAYLEDLDISYRAKLAGYVNWYEPKARVLHVGSATSGSRYNHFKVIHAAGNNVYLLYKNMPLLQLVVNAPLLLAGFLIKYLFFVKKGLGRDYREGLVRGIRLCRANPGRRTAFGARHIPICFGIQLELWRNIFRLV